MNHTRVEKTINDDLAKGLGMHMILIWGRVALVQGIPFVLSYNHLITVVCTMLLMGYYFYVLFIKYKCIPIVNQGAIFTAVFVLITIAFTLIMWPGNKQYMDPIGNTIFYEVCPFIILSMIKDVGILYDSMVKASRVLLVLCVISSLGIVVYGHTTVSTWSNYSMPLGYATLYAVMWLMCDFFNKGKISSLVLVVVGVLILLLFGSRNTLLSVVAFIILGIIRNRRNNTWLKSLLWIPLAACLEFGDQILLFINSIARNYGVSSRTIDLFLNQRYFEDSRASIHQNIFEVINKHPFGVGIAGDVAQTKEFAHGLYVSILCTYGYVIGAVVIIALAVVLIKAYMKSYGTNRDVLIIYLLTVLPRGFTGGDVWSSDAFWWMLGIALSIVYMRQNGYRESYA